MGFLTGFQPVKVDIKTDGLYGYNGLTRHSGGSLAAAKRDLTDCCLSKQKNDDFWFTTTEQQSDGQLLIILKLCYYKPLIKCDSCDYRCCLCPSYPVSNFV